MSVSTLKLSIENLWQIKNLLDTSHDQSVRALDSLLSMSNNLLPTDENRKLLHTLLDSHSKIVRELAEVDSFLQYCDLDSSKLTAEQQQLLMECQAIYKGIKKSNIKIIDFVMQERLNFNNSGCFIQDDLSFKNQSTTLSANYIENKTIITDEMTHDYQQYRQILGEMHQEFLFVDPRYMMETSAKRLNLRNGNTFHIETEHEMNILMDYGLFQCRRDGNSIVERYYQKNKGLYTGHKLFTLNAVKNARVSLLQIIKPLGENGLIVKDNITNETLIMIDNGLNKLANSQHNHAILTHYLVMYGFIMTTGAATPVDLSSPSGIKMWDIFEKLIDYKQNSNNTAYLQSITDLYKIVVHDNIAKEVASQPLPMGWHGMLQQS